VARERGINFNNFIMYSFYQFGPVIQGRSVKSLSKIAQSLGVGKAGSHGLSLFVVSSLIFPLSHG
jgi:hypothetical protein